MAYLRRTLIGGATYIYIMQSVRKGVSVGSRILEYLGREDRLEPGRLQKALTYWGVKAKRKARKGGR
jgi:hypothetical protein